MSTRRPPRRPRPHHRPPSARTRSACTARKVPGRVRLRPATSASTHGVGCHAAQPHPPHARIRRIDVTEALHRARRQRALTAADVPCDQAFASSTPTQPVLGPRTWSATRASRWRWSPPDHPGDRPRGGGAHPLSYYEVLPAVTDPRRRWDEGVPAAARRQPGAEESCPPPGRPAPTATRRVGIDYEVGMQDQAFLGPESGLAVPPRRRHRPLRRHPVAARRPAACSAGARAAARRARLHLAGRGAFRGREGPVGARHAWAARPAHREAGGR
jgi:hypothetical protein